MNWDAPYVISRSLRLEVSPTGTGKLLAMASLSRRPHEMDLDALPVLLAFSAGAAPREVFGRLLADWEVEEAGFEAVVETMVEQELLTPAGAGGAEPSLAATGFGSVLSHFGMLKDTLRVLSYRSAIERQARDKVVVEIGCGTGVLSLFAARAGARRVIAIEESRIAEVAARMFAVNDGAGVIDLRVANSRNVDLDEPADLVIHEILGVDPFEENLLPVLEDARRRLLRPGGRFLPYRLEVCCLGVELKEPLPEDGRRLAEAREFAGLYGLDFAPFLGALAEVKPPDSSRKWLGDQALFEPRILSEESRLLDLDLATDALDLAGSSLPVPLRIQQEGSLGGVVLFFRAHLDEQILITTSPLAPTTHWGWDLRAFSRRVPVSPGDQVPLVVEIGERAGIQGLSIRLAERPGS
jgi:protein arginine N-methyltransferase 1